MEDEEEKGDDAVSGVVGLDAGVGRGGGDPALVARRWRCPSPPSRHRRGG